MKIVESVAEIVAERRARGAGDTGFVPTMGALHEAHLSLVRRALAENARAWTSIFVNPSQFNDPGDLARYPRPLEQDLEMLRAAGCDLVFVPRAREIYPDGYRYRVSESELSLKYCGAGRPGHFDGVLTVVLKLLLLISPERAYFGEKDYQQLQLVEGLVEAFFLDTRIVRCPLVREPDGLAMSSRNRLLTPDERRRAPALHRVLAASLAARRPAAEAARELTREGFEVEYVADHDGRRLAAVRLGPVRLIDNVG
ncbi:MAG TPA: pantoate--beta-alanine ligase [Steroidobacteraceae bacterium]